MAATEAFVLHTIPWRETSLVVEAFCPTEGRLGLIAKGARRPRSAMRGLLQPFTPLWIRYTDKGELRVLQAAEWQAGLAPLQAEALLSGFYLNELLLRLTARNDPQPEIFTAYTLALHELSACTGQPAESRQLSAVLRRFECQLLEGLGLAPWLGDAEFEANTLYAVSATDAPLALHPTEPTPPHTWAIPGHTLQVLARASALSVLELAGLMAGGGVASSTRQLLSRLLGHHCGNTPLASRESLSALRSFSTRPSPGMLPPSSNGPSQ